MPARPVTRALETDTACRCIGPTRITDWVITIVLWIACYLLEKIDGFRREFSITDTSLQHTFAVHERIPVWSLGLMCLFPLIFYIAIGWGIMRSYWDVHNAVLSEVLAIALTISVTTIVKVAVGRPRPVGLDTRATRPLAGTTTLTASAVLFPL